MTIYCGNICYPGFVSCPKKIILIDAFNVDLILKGADWKDREWTLIAIQSRHGQTAQIEGFHRHTICHFDALYLDL